MEVSSPFEDLSDIGSQRVDGLPMLLEDPYVEAALQAPPSFDYVPSPEHPPSPVYVPYVPEPTYPEFMPPDDDVLLAEEQPLPAAVSPTTDSPADYPDDRDDEEEEESSGDDADDEEEDEDKDKDEMSIRYQTPIPFPSTIEVDRFLAISNPPSSPLTSYSSSLPQIPSLPTTKVVHCYWSRYKVEESSSTPTTRALEQIMVLLALWMPRLDVTQRGR
ncbi:hypothetical protein Tco_0159246 [Tanacetum coccineum]